MVVICVLLLLCPPPLYPELLGQAVGEDADKVEAEDEVGVGKDGHQMAGMLRTHF